MSGDKKDGGILPQIMVPVAVALLAGGSAPWWWDKIISPLLTPPSPLLTPTPLPQTPTPLPQTPIPTQTAVTYDSISGNWVVIENLKTEQGWWTIIWAFTADVYKTSLTLRGNKKRVNGKEPTLGEKQAIVIFKLTLDGIRATGAFEETNYRNETLQGTIEIVFANDFKSFSGRVFQGGEKVGTLIGNKQ
jgi:hypothetical protein